MRELYDYNKNIQNEAMQFVKPLFDHLGFNCFAYVRHYHGDKYFLYVSNPDIVQRVLSLIDESRYYVFQFVPKLNEKKIIFWDASQSTKWSSLLKDLNHYNGVSILNRAHEDYVDSWFFGASNTNTQILNVYNNHFNLIEKFIVYFQAITKDLFNLDNPENLFKYRDNNLFLDLKNTNNCTDINFKKFIEAINLKKLPLTLQDKEVNCTQNELQTMKLLSEGLTTKEISNLLERSPRTIESQICDLKEKMNLFSTQKLIHYFNQSIYKNFGF
ncbi:MAG: helix-turn-helix transcriptional regulator [Alphaproteobacteria bacterium]|nr:helix-turn-helix transcriptional regulator [Alphaproteobacteria bacterium]